MNIVHVTAGLSSQGGGVKEVVQKLAFCQQKTGINSVAVIGLEDDLLSGEIGCWSEVNLHAHKILGPKSFGFAPSLDKTLRSIDPDIIHLHGLWMYPNLSVLRWHLRTNKPYLVSVHGMLSPVALSYSSMKKKFVRHVFQDKVLYNAAAFHSTSSSESLEIINWGLNSPVFEIPNGVDLPAEGAVSRHNTFKVLTLGRVHKKKGLSNLVQAWRVLEPKFPHWTLEIVGPDEGGEVARLKVLVKQLGLKRVAFQGAVLGELKSLKYASASLFVLPTLSENFAITVAESLSFGVPVVSTKGAPWSALEDNGCGRWVDIGVDSLIEGLSDLMLRSPEERASMGRRGRLWMERSFNWSAISADFVNVYEKIIRGQHK